MVPNHTSDDSAEEYRQGDLFFCDVADAVLKDIIPGMEHPFYSLTKRPERVVRHYEHNGNWIEISPSIKGLVTIYDKDILIYCVSQVVHRMNEAKEDEVIGPKIRITSRNLLRFTNRGTSGRDYKSLEDGLDRLAGTRIKTNIRTGNEEELENFGLINGATIRRKVGRSKGRSKGRMLWVDIELSNWVMNALKTREVLTLHPDYFRLGQPIERRLYELARKHCGRQSEWKISLELLLKKCGSQSPEKKFRLIIKKIAQRDRLPDYHMKFDEATDMVTFLKRTDSFLESGSKPPPIVEDLPPLPTWVYEEARKAAPGYNVDVLEAQWRRWWARTGKKKIDNVPGAFIGFCNRRHQRKPLAPKEGELAAADDLAAKKAVLVGELVDEAAAALARPVGRRSKYPSRA